ncbi:GNAT family N-acetyltransferase [Candidatus Pacearchaeota archaeon]|nr:GNAT family N-acetyltransferase [Candidatus Pacearchaeota archaeon]
MIIKKAELKDCKACLELSKIPELLNPDGTPSHLWWIESFVNENQIFYVAEERGEIIGFTMGERTTGNIAIRHSTFVKPEFRGKGIGSKLIEQFEAECKRRKLKAIMSYGYAKNNKTIKFFEGKGYIKGALTYEFIKFL